MVNHNDDGIYQQPIGDGSRDSEDARVNGSNDMQMLISIARNLEKGQERLLKGQNDIKKRLGNLEKGLKDLLKGQDDLRTKVKLLNEKLTTLCIQIEGFNGKIEGQDSKIYGQNSNMSATHTKVEAQDVEIESARI